MEAFLERRDAAYNLVREAFTEVAPKLMLGAEVRYYEGISKLSGLKKLCIGDSGLLLLEMPFTKWSDYTISELFDMSRSSEYRMVMAHVERYYDLQDKNLWYSLSENEVMFQVNSSTFTSLLTRRKALSLLKKGLVHFLGSDCHGIEVRPPLIRPAYDLLQKKLGDDLVSRMLDFGYSFLK